MSDDHPIIHSSRTTTDTTTESTGIKTASKTPRDHGQDKIRPLFVYCNLTKSQHGNNALMKAVAYNNAKTLIQCNPLQFYSLRGQLLDIVEVSLTEWNRSKVQFNEDRMNQKQDGPARKYIEMDESVERDTQI